LIVDLSGQSVFSGYSDMARLALGQNTLSAYEATLNLWLRYEIDYLLGSWNPELTIKNTGIGLVERATYTFSRSFINGEAAGLNYLEQFPVVTGTLNLPTSVDVRLNLFFRIECPARDLIVIFTTIPHGGGPMTPSPYDNDWARTVAQQLGLPYAEVDGAGLFTGDGQHLGGASADIFSERLAKALIAPGIDIAQRIRSLRH
jgi:hypothetical protein